MTRSTLSAVLIVSKLIRLITCKTFNRILRLQSSIMYNIHNYFDQAGIKKPFGFYEIRFG